jgi:cholest-4-en-3-one 26-monooxygenase
MSQTRVLSPVNMAYPDAFVRGEQHELFRRLRTEAPVSWNAPFEVEGRGVFPGFWNITKYADVMAISRDPSTFISSHGITMGTNPENAGPAAGLGKMLIVTDPPRHVRLRRLVNKGFTPRAVAAWEPHVREITRGILDDIAPKGACDFVTDAAALLPLAVICEIMGVPKDDWKLMFELTNKVLGGGDPEYQAEGADIEQTVGEGHMRMFQYFMRMLAEHHQQRRDDLLGTLIDSDIDGDKLTDEEILYFAYLLILAGNETTRNAISGGLLALFEHPAEKQKLQNNPALLPTAVEEIVRWTSPVAHMARAATRDVQLRGQQIRTGEQVVMWYPSVNRDEEVFPDGDVFNVERDPNDHLAFGIGEHFCLGAGFARLEIRVMFEELLRRLPDIEQDGPVERLKSTFISGVKHLPVRFTPQRVRAAV